MRKLADFARSPQYPSLRSVPNNLIGKGASIPAPVWGWDTESPRPAMKPDHAVRLDNWFPQPGWVEVRKDKIRHSNTLTGEPVETVATWNGQATSAMFAVSDGTIFDVTAAANGAPVVTGLNSSRWQYVNFGATTTTYLWMCSGVDDPQVWDGTAWAVPTLNIVGGGFSPDEIINVATHKNRLWVCFADSATAGYLDIDSFQGDVNTFDLGPIFAMGGYLMAIGSWSVDAGDGLDDYAVFVSSKGQIAIYRGTDPSDPAEWSLVGVFTLGSPIGRRCLLEVGPDIAVIAIDGVLPLSKAMIFERAAVTKVSMTQRIQSAMNDAARDYKDNFGWQLLSYPKGTRAILNVPEIENQTQVQFVMNTLTGAWCRFTGMNANCWELYQERLFYGGNDGFVYEADRSGLEQNETSFRADMMTAFNYYGIRGRQKRWTYCRPLLTTDSSVNPGIAFNTDFRDDAPISVPSTGAEIDTSRWDSSTWDVDTWDGGEARTHGNWIAVDGIGYCASIRMVVDVTHPHNERAGRWGRGTWGVARWGRRTDAAEIVLQVNSFDTTHDVGAFI